jgi:heme exporter protein D
LTFDSHYHLWGDIHAGGSFAVAVWHPVAKDSRGIQLCCLVSLVLLATIEQLKTISQKIIKNQEKQKILNNIRHSPAVLEPQTRKNSGLSLYTNT